MLVVEQSPFLRLVLREVLARANHETVGECNGLKEAASLAGNLGPDVVLLDLEGSNEEWSAELAAIHHRVPTARVIAIGPPGLPLTTARNDVDTYINKPCTPEAVLSAIRRDRVRDGVLPA
ncbi:MAG: response regulator [Bacteroidota bacterium]